MLSETLKVMQKILINYSAGFPCLFKVDDTLHHFGCRILNSKKEGQFLQEKMAFFDQFCRCEKNKFVDKKYTNNEGHLYSTYLRFFDCAIEN